ncbi:MAG: TfoX/Sxy family protein [Frankiaceae bacterium]|nr:TfoX/Sxy family protein [Frankiaceae bacterium]
MSGVRLSDLPNLGLVTETQLTALGISTPQQLADVGPVEAWRQLRAAYPTVNRICLYALAGALEGVDWRDLPAAVLADLRAVPEN